MSEPCPSQERLKEHLDGTLPADDQAMLTEHLDGCADCRKTLEMLAGGSDSLLDVARHAGQATDAATPALNEVLAKFQAPPSETQAEPAGAKDDSLSFLMPSEKPGCLGRLEHYEVQEVIGKGGFGIVLKAFDEKLHRVVAIKVLSPAYAAIGSARKRFIREAQSAAAVKNEHVVAIYSVKDETQPPYLVMELIDGISLQDKLDQKGSLSLKEILRIGLQTAEGLAAAHKQGLVHRDIKPANILLENGVERVRITDFGLARAVDDASVTQSGTVAGTPMYMSPEQAEGLPIDHRSDLFSLGTVLYAMCTGHPPFRASGTHAVLKRVIDASPRPIREINNEIPDWLCAIIAKLHAKTPGERFQTAKEVGKLLGQHLAHIQEPSQTPLPAPTAVPTAIVPGATETGKSQPMVAAPRRPVRMAVIVLAIAAIVMVPCMIPAGIVLFLLLSSSQPDPMSVARVVRPQKNHNLILIRDDPTISLFANPEEGGQNGFIFDGLEFGTVLPPGRYQVQGKKNDVLVFQQWVTLDADQTKTVHVHSGWVQLFNGKDTTGWKIFPADKDVWRVKDGILVGQGADCSMLPSERGDFGDFHLSVEAMINEGGDSGVWFRTDLKSQDGYEANINHSHRDPARTGSLGIKKNHMQKWLHHQNKSPAPANTWFVLEVIAAGPNFTVKVDGVTVAQVKDANRSSGHFGLEMFGKGSVAHFRKIEIKELLPAEPGWVRLFNGKDLDGWNFPLGQSQWKVINGVLTGSAKRGEYGILPTLREYSSFHLRTQVRLTGPGNSGILFRTEDGYEAEIDAGTTGSIARGKPFAWLERKRHSLVKPGSWCDLELIADGPKLTTKVNGQVVASVADATVARSFVGLQVDARDQGPVVVEFRKIEIKELPPEEPGWVQLFNGKDLTGWKTHPDQPGLWQVEDGEIVGSTGGGPVSHLYSTRGDFRNFHLRAEVKINRDRDSGIHFHCTPYPEFDLKPSGGQGKQPLGYEANIAKSTPTTGGIGSIWRLDAQGKVFHRPGRDVPIQANTWFLLEIVMKGNHIVTKVNGKIVEDFRDEAGPATGHFALEAMYAPTIVHFKKIEIKELPPEDPDWVQLFNGSDLKGWQTGQPDQWKVENGTIIGRGGKGYLGTDEKFENFHCRLEAKINADGWGGLAFRNSGENHGSVSICPKLGKSGSLFFFRKGNNQLLQQPTKQVASPDTWLKLELIVQGKNVVVLVNGTTTAEANIDGLPDRGPIFLNADAPGTVIHFRKIEIKELPATKK